MRMALLILPRSRLSTTPTPRKSSNRSVTYSNRWDTMPGSKKSSPQTMRIPGICIPISPTRLNKTYSPIPFGIRLPLLPCNSRTNTVLRTSPYSMCGWSNVLRHNAFVSMPKTTNFSPKNLSLPTTHSCRVIPRLRWGIRH